MINMSPYESFGLIFLNTRLILHFLQYFTALRSIRKLYYKDDIETRRSQLFNLNKTTELGLG